MPSINRIRVNNVKYNFGTQQYDDFTMRMYGKNTLYDLANGGGKSILMLLLLQNLIPNCTLDEKQPIEKLFRSGGGNTTIHSLIEWKLDETDVKDGYRYLTTGFCARKAKDSADGEEGERDSASVEYFNYCIFYRNYNDHDIVNLPLVKDGERITYSGFKSYLKELAHRDMNLEVQVFERKGEYQRYIAKYGLYESHWEIVRGINKTEGHVRTYFETNYKTARKVVEDLLIEEIIEKAYLAKIETESGTDDMARTLLDIKDKLVELAKKKREITDYDRQTELLHVLEGRVASFLELYETQKKQCDNIADVCVTGEQASKSSEEKMKELSAEREERLTIINECKLLVESLKVKREQLKAVKLSGQAEVLQKELEAEEGRLFACQKELNQKESMNDYLDYEKDKALKEEHEAIIEASLSQNDDQIEKLHAMALEKKRRDDEELAALKAEVKKEEQEETHASLQVEVAERTLREAEVAYAVAEHEKEQKGEQYRKQVLEMQELRSHLTKTSFLNPEELLRSVEEMKQDQKRSLHELTAQLEQDRENYYSLSQTVSEKTKEVEALQEELNTLEAHAKEYQSQTDALKRMLDIYDAHAELGEGKTAEWLTGQDLTRLIQKIQQRYLQNIALLSEKRKALAASKKRLADWKEGRLIAPSEAMERAKYYIESRHNMDALYGMDYLAAQPVEEQERLLKNHPMLPYGLLVESFEVLDSDEKLKELNLSDGFVPVYNKSLLDVMSTEGDSECVMFLRRGSRAFLDKEQIKQEIHAFEEAIKQSEIELERLTEMNDTYQEDSAFVMSLRGLAVLDVEERRLALKDSLREGRQEKERLNEELAALTRDLEEHQTRYDEVQKEYYALLAEEGSLDAIRRLSTRMTETEEEKRAAEQEYQRLRSLKSKYEQELHQWKSAWSEHSNRLRTAKEQLNERQRGWEEDFKEYYISASADGGKNRAYGSDEVSRYSLLSDSELEAEFKAVRAVFKKETVALEDKRKLIDALKSSMERALKSIRRRGVEPEELEELKREHRLFYVPEEELNRLSEEAARIGISADRLRQETEAARQQVTRLEGSIEQAILTLEERYGTYKAPDASADDIELRITEREAELKHLNEEYKASEKEYQQYSREYTAMSDLYKDVKRIVETNGIPLEDAKLLNVEKDKLRETFERSLLGYDKSTKALERAKNELQRYKNQTAQALQEMQAYEMAQTVNSDVEIPKNFGEAKQLKDNLGSMIHVISLEKERIGQSIEDMEFIKTSFEKQCMERCQDVKNELEKLPKLSRIMLDGEMIQMVGLSIPYVKDEFIHKRMSDYIDDVVSGSDRFENQAERMKYIRSKLELKRLFSVIVTDMNGIRLTLYKRERIREQSRYLRYEEAVGSTGQSQGIYIQFLVAVINYISGLYAPNVENDRLMKTIFIDNPFGAAKDVYIWEPIFEMLKVNHVQLIVPARGATPAITARFDVNYILGQQMVGKRQQTVVVDYRSQVEQEEVEYRNLEYDQVSFDFI